MSCSGFAAILGVMLSCRKVIVVLLAIVLALGLGLSPGQADAPAKMTLTSSMDGMGHCKQCPDDGGVAKLLGSCSVTCSASVMAAMPDVRPVTLALLLAGIPPQESLLLGRAFSPEPHPPRYID